MRKTDEDVFAVPVEGFNAERRDNPYGLPPEAVPYVEGPMTTAPDPGAPSVSMSGGSFGGGFESANGLPVAPGGGGGGSTMGPLGSVLPGVKDLGNWQASNFPLKSPFKDAPSSVTRDQFGVLSETYSNQAGSKIGGKQYARTPAQLRQQQIK